MDKWLEVEDSYLTNQPTITTGYGKNRQVVPDPDIEPTEMWLFVYDCKRTKSGISRKRRLEVIKGKNGDELEQKLMDFTVRDGVLLIQVENSSNYIQSRAEPDPIAIGA